MYKHGLNEISIKYQSFFQFSWSFMQRPQGFALVAHKDHNDLPLALIYFDGTSICY